MSKTTSESIPDNQTNEEGVFQQDDAVKQETSASRSNITLETLPTELLEHILLTAIAMEVEEMHLVKSVWKRKADLVIFRLETVCKHWSNILMTNYFQDEIYRILDRTVEKTFSLEILNHFPVQSYDLFEVLTFWEEIFVLCEPQLDIFAVYVYDYSSDRTEFPAVKHVIALPGLKTNRMAACSESNCLYVLNLNRHNEVLVYRITKEGEHQFSVSPLICGSWEPHEISVAANGSIILWKRNETIHPAEIIVYDANGSFQQDISSYSTQCNFCRIIPKPNGNFVFASNDGYHAETVLTEIDMNGAVVRRYQSSLPTENLVCLAGKHGLILIFQMSRDMELLDDEFNCLKVNTELSMFWIELISVLHYNSENNQIAGTLMVAYREPDPCVLIFHFVEK